jgi:hypothetical protein
MEAQTFYRSHSAHSCIFARFIIAGMRCNYIALAPNKKRKMRGVWLESVL